MVHEIFDNGWCNGSMITKEGKKYGAFPGTFIQITNAKPLENVNNNKNESEEENKNVVVVENKNKKEEKKEEKKKERKMEMEKKKEEGERKVLGLVEAIYAFEKMAPSDLNFAPGFSTYFI